MAATVDTFKTRFPEFALADDGLVSLVLDEAEAQINREVWGERKGDIGQLFLAAHTLAMTPSLTGAGGTGPRGPVSDESVGDVSVSYGTTYDTTTVNDLASTNYGQQYLRLRRQVVKSPLVI